MAKLTLSSAVKLVPVLAFLWLGSATTAADAADQRILPPAVRPYIPGSPANPPGSGPAPTPAAPPPPSASPGLPYSPPPGNLDSRSDTLRSEELQIRRLEQSLGSNDPEARELRRRLADAQRRLNNYRMAPTAQDADLRRHQVDDALRSLEMQRLRTEQEAIRRRGEPPDSGSGQEQK